MTHPPLRKAIALLTAALLCLVLAAPALAATTYGVFYEVQILPTTRSASVRIRVEQRTGLLKKLRFRIDPERHREFAGDGVIVPTDGFVEWTVPASGGSLRYSFFIDHLRDARSYDARCADSWALFRGDDLVPPARATTAADEEARARLRLRMPDGWTAATPYPQADSGWFEIDDPRRRFDRPVGWIVAGARMGIVRETVSGVGITIAGPARHGFRRHDILAMLRWTLPTLREVTQDLPDRILVVGAGDPMWRGGLSGPRSLFIHADRPMITPDASSPLLHETMHTILGLRGAEGSDWIVEGLAELYSLEALVRSGSISRKRFERALTRLSQDGQAVQDLHVPESTGAVTSRAVSVLAELDGEIRRRSGNTRSLDDAVRALVGQGKDVDGMALREAAEAAAGAELAAFFRTRRMTKPGP